MKKNTLSAELTQRLLYLKLPWVRENFEELAAQVVVEVLRRNGFARLTERVDDCGEFVRHARPSLA